MDRDVAERKRAEKEIFKLDEDLTACPRAHGAVAGDEQGTGGIYVLGVARSARSAAHDCGLQPDVDDGVRGEAWGIGA